MTSEAQLTAESRRSARMSCSDMATSSTATSLPAALTARPSPLIGFIGLDISERHANLWKAFCSSSSSSSAAGMGDRVSLRYRLLADADSVPIVPPPKPKRSSYEWFIPKGIIKVNWMNKHLNVLPAVAVIFIELNWTDAKWADKKAECASRVQAVRVAFQGRATKLALVLIQEETADHLSVASSGQSENVAFAEKAAELCSVCELSARSLFVLPVVSKDRSSIGTQPNLMGYIIRLENALYEVAQNYYHQEIRRVKSHRDFLNKTTHLYLFVRHQFKAGFLSELKRDLHSAYKHYQQSYNLLMEVRATDTNIMEVKTVAGFINYKMCRLAILLNLPRDAISQFRRHMDIFKHKVGLEGLAFEHSGWQSEQCRTFAEIFADAIRQGLPAIQTQHPGLYYQQAAQHAITRRRLAEELCSDVDSQPDFNPLINEDKLEFYGQRPWRPGKVSIEPPDMDLENSAIRALLFREKTLRPSHSEMIVELLSKAIEQYDMFRSPRSKSHLTVQMAEQLMYSQKYRQALDLLRPTIDMYRQQGWSVLLNACLGLALKCAYLVTSVEDYVTLAMEMASLSGEPIQDNLEEKQRIMTNLCRIFSNSQQAPSAEPGLTSKAERAAVSDAIIAWNGMLKQPGQVHDVRLPFDVARKSVLRLLPVFECCRVKADGKARIHVYVKNHGPVAATDAHSITLKTVHVVVSPTSTWLPLTLTASETEQTVAANHVVHFSTEFQPPESYVGLQLAVHHVILCISSQNITINVQVLMPDESIDSGRCTVEPEFSCVTVNKAGRTDWTDGSALDFSAMLPSHLWKVAVDSREARMSMKVCHNGPALVNEWFLISVQLANDEPVCATTVSVSARLSDSQDPTIADTTRLVCDFRTADPVTPAEMNYAFTVPPAVVGLEQVAEGARAEVTFYMRPSTTAHRSIELQLEYQVQVDNTGYRCQQSEVVHLETVEPFLFTSELLSMPKQQPLRCVYADEPFLILPELKSICPHGLRILDTNVNVRHPVRKFEPSLLSQLSGCTFYPESEGQECVSLVVSQSDLQTGHMHLDEQEVVVGKYVVRWMREDLLPRLDGDNDFVAVSVFELPSVKVCTASFSIKAVFGSPYATIRTPFQATYVLVNKSDRVQELQMSIEPSDAFRFSGNKHLHLKLLPDGESVDLKYVFIPLITGEAVPLPRLRLNLTRLTSHPHEDSMTEAIERLLPTHIAVLPSAMGSSCSTASDDRGSLLHEVLTSVVLENASSTRIRSN